MVYLMIVSIFVLMFLGIPVVFSLGISSVAFILFTTDIPGEIIPELMTGAVNSLTMIAIPLFLLAGNIMNSAGITDRIFKFAKAVIGPISGGLGLVNVLASLIFSGMSGSAVADIGGLGQIEIDAMNKEGYDLDFSSAITAASACIGPIFPPSVMFLIYGVMAEVSIGKLFLGGIIPGVLMAIFLMITVFIIAKSKKYPVGEKTNFRKIIISLKEAFFSLITPIIILFGFFSGIFTVTEAAVIAVLWTLFLGFFIYRTLNLKKLGKIILNSGIESATIICISAVASPVGWIITKSRIPLLLAEKILSFSLNTNIILILVCIFLLILGCFLEAISSMIILTPILVPTLVRLGVNPVHFGVVMTLTLMIGLLTPPFGMGLFTVMKVANISFERVSKAVWPFIVTLIIVMLLLIYFPQTVLFLPNLLIP